MAPKLNRRRAVFVLSKIDEILSWEKATDRERDSKFVELGRYLCEVRAGQYWRVDNVRSFDEFLERKFPESRRKAYYLMAIHEQLPRIHKFAFSIANEIAPDLVRWSGARAVADFLDQLVMALPRSGHADQPPGLGFYPRGLHQ